jgi:hypothetical protein
VQGFAQVMFENQAEALGAGIAFGYINLGAGISFYDYNGDGLDDITLAASDTRNYTFLKNVGGIFVQEDLGIDNGGFQSKQVIWVDYDNDGDNDFFSASDTTLSKLFRNDNGTFTDVTLAAGFPGIVYKTFGASWGDYNNDGFLDVFLSIRDASQLIPNILYRNNGDGTFTNVTLSAGLEPESYFSFCAAFVDLDNDGDQDIFVANDRYFYRNLMYRNNGDGTFENISASSGTDFYMDAMSTTIGDYNMDGLLDIYVTNSGITTPPQGNVIGNVLFRNNGDLTFTNVAAETGTKFDSFAWSAVFLDADNEGFPDLYVSGQLDGSMGNLPSAFYEHLGNDTYQIPSNIGFESDNRESYSNAIGDVDNDGLAEIVVMNNFENIFLWKNLSTTDNNWIKIKLEGVISNRMGIGSFIEVSAGESSQIQYTLCGEGYLGQNSGYEFFGLNNATTIDYIEVRWLSGVVDHIVNVPVNQHITIKEGVGILNAEPTPVQLFTLAPNPAHDFVTLSFAQETMGALRLIDLNGKELGKWKVHGTQHQIDVQHMVNGIYLVELVSEGAVFRSKLVVHK